MVASVFVGRERELARLEIFLERSVAGRGQIAFVAGEAGTGKTALLQEFARRAQVKHDALVVASGNCNAFTGLGDPYLPFREILGQLLADPAARPDQGPTSVENAKRIQTLLARSLDILVDVGPDLASLLLPGSSIVGKIAQTVLKKTGVLEKLARRQPKGPELVSLEGQSRLLEQYSSFLRQLAAEQPLLLILDDLHWVDLASTTLLFHLGRRIEAAPILIIGAYRSDEVAVGRGAERHPLEKVIAEFQRYFGEIELDLAQSIAEEGQSFVNAYLGTQPNRLDQEFRQALFAHTQGHPLFTVELVQSLQERGDLRRDEQGRWVADTTLDWDGLPTRIESVIEERLARLDDELRDTLNIGSVMGYDFYAQVVALVQQEQERDLLRKLARELDRRHRLVQEQGETRVGSHYLSHYRFTHVLIQQFLYNELSAGERQLLHSEVAAALEALYTSQTEASAIQLARHYAEAGNEAKAAEYEIQAGDASTRTFAYPEARLHYQRALEMLRALEQTDTIRRIWVDTTIKYADIAANSDDPVVLRTRLIEADGLLTDLSLPLDIADRTRRVHLHRALGLLHEYLDDFATSLAYLRPLLEETQTIGNEELYRELPGLLGALYVCRGYFAQALPLLIPSVAYLETRSNWRKWVYCATDLSLALIAVGQCAEGIAVAQKCLQLGQETHHNFTIAIGYAYLSTAYIMLGDDHRTVEATQAFLQAADQGGELVQKTVARVFHAHVQSRQGQHDLARESLEQAQQLAEMRRSIPTFYLLPALKAEILFNAGQYAEAIDEVEQVLARRYVADSPWVQGRVQRTWAQALAASEPAAWDEVEVHFAASLAAFEPNEARIEAAHTHVAWGRLLVQRGNAKTAREHWTFAAAQFEQSDLQEQLVVVRALLNEIQPVN